MKRLLLVALFVVPFVGRGQPQPALLNQVVVVVNNTVITYKEVLNAIRGGEELLASRYANQPQVFHQKQQELVKESIETLVEKQLILDEFQKAGYNLPESVIETRINNVIREAFGGNQLVMAKTLQQDGLTMEAYRKRTRDRVIVQVMSEHFVPHDPAISPAKIEQYYRENEDQFKLPDRVKMRLITLLNRPDQPRDSARKRADEIVVKLKEGAPFAEMAKIYSQDSKASEGGDQGWVDKKVFRPEITEKAFLLKAGQWSDVIETSEASYVLLVEETSAAHIRPLSEMRDDIDRRLKGEERERLRSKWIDRLKQKSFIRYF